MYVNVPSLRRLYAPTITRFVLPRESPNGERIRSRIPAIAISHGAIENGHFLGIGYSALLNLITVIIAVL